MITRENRVITFRLVRRKYADPRALPIYQPEYITLDALYRMYKAFRYLARRDNQHCKVPDYWYQVKDPDCKVVGNFCTSFGDFVDLHIKTKLYRLY